MKKSIIVLVVLFGLMLTSCSTGIENYENIEINKTEGTEAKPPGTDPTKSGNGG